MARSIYGVLAKVMAGLAYLLHFNSGPKIHSLLLRSIYCTEIPLFF